MAITVAGGCLIGGAGLEIALKKQYTMPGWGDRVTVWTADKDYGLVICYVHFVGTGHTVCDFAVQNAGSGSTILINQPEYIQHYQNEPTGQDNPVFVILNAKEGMKFVGRQNRSATVYIYAAEGDVEKV